MSACKATDTTADGEQVTCCLRGGHREQHRGLSRRQGLRDHYWERTTPGRGDTGPAREKTPFGSFQLRPSHLVTGKEIGQ